MSDDDVGGILSELEGARAELEAWRADPSKDKRVKNGDVLKAPIKTGRR